MTTARILVVEDENIVAKDIQGRLNSLGYAVPAIASSGEDAINKAAETHPHLVLMDIVLKGQMDGIEAAEQIQRRFNIPVIYLTAYGDNETLERAKSTEPFGYILKPFDEREIRTAVEIALYKSQMERRLRESQQRLAVLHEIELAITSSLELQTVIELLLKKIDLLLPYAGATTVRLFNREKEELEPIACRNLNEEEWRAGRALAQEVLKTKAPLAVSDVQKGPRTQDVEFFRRHGLVSYLGVPLIAKDEVLGILGFYTQEEHPFGTEEVEFLATLGAQAAIAIHNSQLHEQVKRQAAELERANRLQSDFLSVMSHEFKTPLNVVMGYAGMIRDKILRDQDQALGKIVKYSNDLLVMIDALLDASRIEAGPVPVMRQETGLTNFLDDLKSLYEFPLEKDVALHWNYARDLPIVKMDGVKLRHILQNLINNAIKFTEKGTVGVTVRCLPERKIAEFKVADTGVGIAKEKLTVIFERFHQVDNSLKRNSGGVGLGLYIVKTFTEMLGGKVEVDSTPGRGSTFTVTLPYDN